MNRLKLFFLSLPFSPPNIIDQNAAFCCSPHEGFIYINYISLNKRIGPKTTVAISFLFSSPKRRMATRVARNLFERGIILT